MRTSLLALLLACGTIALPRATPSREQPATPARLRYPVALALTDDGHWLYTANQRSGSISILDTKAGKVVGEVVVGRRLADLVLTHDAHHLLAVDEAASELIVLDRQDADLMVRQRLPVAPGPVAVQVSPDGSRGFVASQWQRRLTVVDLRSHATKRHPLPFAPRKMLWLSDSGKLVLADAFGGQLAVFDVERGAVEAVRVLPAHNIRGLALSPDRKFLLVAHQVLHRLGPTTRDNVHWGNVVTNNLRAILLANLLDPRGNLLADSRLHQLGEAGLGGGDPSGVAAVAETHVVTLGGVGEAAVGPDKLGLWQRLKVGRRPTAVVVSPDGQRAYVADTFGDAISVLDLGGRFLRAEIPLGVRPALSASERGEHLFYDARLSHDGWLSCHSCHTDGHTNGLLSDTLGDDSFGAPKRVLSLLGVKDTAPYAWNGSVPDLETQIRKSVATTTYGPKLSDMQVQDLATYLRTLTPPPPPEQDKEHARRGQVVFEKQGCAACHAAPSYTSGKTYDVGLKDEMGQRHFNPPSLRGVGHGGAFFHDGRAATLDEVFVQHRHQLQGELTREELRDLLAFLRGL